MANQEDGMYRSILPCPWPRPWYVLGAQRLHALGLQAKALPMGFHPPPPASLVLPPLPQLLIAAPHPTFPSLQFSAHSPHHQPPRRQLWGEPWCVSATVSESLSRKPNTHPAAVCMQG
mmetsp:Transcript_44064/g.115801  ORF Transcript_44064/g.115801 Transcript_44064/m.115801 type:complete len:118 (+) Transcript_44064:1397-1750(+)